MLTFQDCYLTDYKIWLSAPADYPPFRPIPAGYHVTYYVENMHNGQIALIEHQAHPAKPDARFPNYGGAFDPDRSPQRILSFETVKTWPIYEIEPSPVRTYDLPLAQCLSENIGQIKNLPQKGIDDLLFIVGDKQRLSFYRFNDEYQISEIIIGGRTDRPFKAVVSYTAFKEWVTLGKKEHLYIEAQSINPNVLTQWDKWGGLSGDYLTVKTGRHTAQFVTHAWATSGGITVDEYRESTTKFETVFTTTYEVFYKAWQWVKICAATDDNRPVLTGIYMALRGDGSITLASTDGFRLVTYDLIPDTYTTTNLPVHGYGLLIPAHDKSLQKLFSQAPKKATKKSPSTLDLPLTLAYNTSQNKVRITLDNRSVNLALIEGKFPDYASIIPKKHRLTCEVYRKELLPKLNSAKVYARDSAYITGLSIPLDDYNNLSKLIIQAHSSEKGTYEGHVSIKTNGQMEGILALNIEYLCPIIAVMDSETITLEFNTPTDPLIIRSGQALYMVMPMRGNEYKPPIKRQPAPVSSPFKRSTIANSGILNRYRALSTCDDWQKLLSTVENHDALARTNTEDGMLYHLHNTPHLQKAMQYQKLALHDAVNCTPRMIPLPVKKQLTAALLSITILKGL